MRGIPNNRKTDIHISRQLTMDRLSVMHMPDVLRTGEHDAEPEEVWG